MSGNISRKDFDYTTIMLGFTYNIKDNYLCFIIAIRGAAVYVSMLGLASTCINVW